MISTKRVTIEVPKPAPIDNGPLDEIFNSSLAISDAESKFWDMKLASKAE